MLLSLPAQAQQVLYNVNGGQELVNLGAGGNISPSASILWNEQSDGAMPPLPGPVGTLESFVDINGKKNLRINVALKAAYDAQQVASAQVSANSASDAAVAKALKAKLAGANPSNLTNAELQQLLLALTRKTFAQ